MTTKQVKTALDRVLTWPKERQQDVVRVLKHMEEQNKSRLHLTPAQAAEVRRRLREKNPKTISLAEFNKDLRQRYGAF